MADSLSQLVRISLEPAGYLLELAEERANLTLKALCDYIGNLRIPQVDLQAVTRAFNEKGGASVLIAPLPTSQAPAPARSQPRSSQVLHGDSLQRQQRVVRWNKPSLRGRTKREVDSILIVDTSTMMVKMFQEAFEGAKVETRYASQPRVFFEAISEKVPDLIMVPSHLGKIDACLLSAKIRLDPRTVGTPVIMYSRPRPRYEIVQAFDSGITDYLVLPVDSPAFRKKVVRVLAQVNKMISSEASKQGGGAKKTPADRPTIPTLEALVRKVKDILAVPHILDRILKISEDSSAGAKELAQAIRSDAATTATTLKKANTVFYGAGAQVREVQQAIVRIGFGEIRCLVLGMSVIKQFSKEQQSNGFDRHDFWRHSLATAILAKCFAQKLRLPSAEEAFVGGLLHDLGKIVLDEYCNPPFRSIVMEAINQMEPILWAEKRRLSYSHIDVGAAMLKLWKFPQELQVVVGRHHTPEAQTRETAKEKDLMLARLVYVANIMAKALGIGSGGDLSIAELPASPWVHNLSRLSFDEDCMGQFQKELAEISDFLGIGPLSDSVSRTGEDLPTVVYIDPTHASRPFSIIGIHLRAMGYEVHQALAPDNILLPADDKNFVTCLRVDHYDKIEQAMDKLAASLGERPQRLVVILPEEERKNTADRRPPAKPASLADHHTMLCEPFTVEQLHNALEAGS